MPVTSFKQLVKLAHDLDKEGKHDDADKITMSLVLAAKGDYGDVDFDKGVETIYFDERDEFNKAIEKYENDPRLIDIGYSDMIIKLEKGASE